MAKHERSAKDDRSKAPKSEKTPKTTKWDGTIGDHPTQGESTTATPDGYDVTYQPGDNR